MTPQSYSDWAIFFLLVETPRHTLLENGLRVVNIFDPNTTQVGLLVLPAPQRSPSPLAAGPEAAVAVAVTVGSFSDPEAGKRKKVRKAGDSLIHRKRKT